MSVYESAPDSHPQLFLTKRNVYSAFTCFLSLVSKELKNTRWLRNFTFLKIFTSLNFKLSILRLRFFF